MEDEFFEKDGFTRLIDKEDIKERLGHSPGKGDAYKMLQWALEKDIRPAKYDSNEGLMRVVPMHTPLDTVQSMNRQLVPDYTPI